MKKIIAIFLLYFLYFQFVLAESENMIDFKVNKILDLENVITGKYDFSLIGEKIRYYEKVILFDGKEYEIEKVKIEFWSEDDLYNETRGTGSRGLTFEDFFAEENDYIKVISIDVAGNYNLFGTYLFVVNKNTIITEYSGVYYLLEPICSQEELIKINPKDFSDYNLEQPGSEVQKKGNEEIFAIYIETSNGEFENVKQK